MKNKNVNKLFWPGLLAMTAKNHPESIAQMERELGPLGELIDEIHQRIREDPEKVREIEAGIDAGILEREGRGAVDELVRREASRMAYCEIKDDWERFPFITETLDDWDSDDNSESLLQWPESVLEQWEDEDGVTRSGFRDWDEEHHQSAPLNMIVLNFAQSGANSVRVFPELAAALQITKIRAPKEHLKVPYEYLEIIPPIEVARSWRELATGDERVESVLVDAPDPGNPYFNVLFLGNGPEGITIIGICLPTEDFLDGEGMLDESQITMVHPGPTGEDERVPLSKLSRAIIRFTFNTILYMNAEESDVRLSARTRASDDQEAAAKKRGKPAPPRSASRLYDVGSKVRIPGTRGGGGDGTGEGPKIKSQFWVRGFWRNQPYGPGRSKTKLKWIKPFVKGKGKGYPVLYGRNYEVDEPEQP